LRGWQTAVKLGPPQKFTKYHAIREERNTTVASPACKHLLLVLFPEQWDLKRGSALGSFLAGKEELYGLLDGILQCQGAAFQTM